MKYVLPEHLLKRAFRSSSGELAWKRTDLEEVVSTYISLGFPIEAFEVWIVNEAGQWTGILPTDSEIGSTFCVYDVERQKQLETQTDFVLRSGKEILEKVKQLNPEKTVLAVYTERIRYNLYVAAEYSNNDQ